MPWSKVWSNLSKFRDEKQAAPKSFSMKSDIKFTKKRDDRGDTIVLYKIMEGWNMGKGSIRNYFTT